MTQDGIKFAVLVLCFAALFVGASLMLLDGYGPWGFLVLLVYLPVVYWPGAGLLDRWFADPT